ncbi:FHA domain-containing protein [bacterium]|nr:FHA domain-containing protein [bacterium]
MPSLTHKRSDGPQRRLGFSAKMLVVGRVNESDVVVHDAFVSRVHCGVGHKEQQFTLKDLGSTNGTYRNGARVFQCVLAAGDRIQVGNTTLVFEMEVDSGDAILRQVARAVAPPPGVKAGPVSPKGVTMPVPPVPPKPSAGLQAT